MENYVMYPPNILSSQNLIMREVILSTEPTCPTSSGLQFFGATILHLPVFSKNISNHSTKRFGNSLKKISCKYVYTYLYIHYAFFSRGFLFSFQENSCSFCSSHSVISFLVGFQTIPSFLDFGSRQRNHLLVCTQVGSRPWVQVT